MCVCVCFWKCYLLVPGFRFDLCFYRDLLAADTTTTQQRGVIQMIPTRDSDSTSDSRSSDILMPGVYELERTAVVTGTNTKETINTNGGSGENPGFNKSLPN